MMAMISYRIYSAPIVKYKNESNISGYTCILKCKFRQPQYIFSDLILSQATGTPKRKTRT